MTRKNYFYDRLSFLVKKSGKSMNCVEHELNYPRNALSNYKNSTMPSAIRLLEISRYFGVSPEYMLGLDEITRPEKRQVTFSTLSFDQKIEMYENAVRWMMTEATSKNVSKK